MFRATHQSSTEVSLGPRQWDAMGHVERECRNLSSQSGVCRRAHARMKLVVMSDGHACTSDRAA
eukprot:2386619-Pyramimonas_sp.AAC.1